MLNKSIKSHMSVDKRQDVSDFVFLSKYSRTVNGRKETWQEAVNRVMEMHRYHLETTLGLSKDKMKQMDPFFNDAYDAYSNKHVLGAQRALQFGGEQLRKHNMRMYNCTSTYLNRVDFFHELFYILLCGAGAGYSVQDIHIKQLPKVKGIDKTKKAELFVIPDSIEGWSESAEKLINAHFNYSAEVVFDYSLIRPKGALISKCFKAPGPEPLKLALDKVAAVLAECSGRRLTSFEAHRIACILADSVVAGGVRRSALIVMFDADDEKMLNCKTGNWFQTYPELARANNSAMVLPNTPRSTFDNLFESAKAFGEPGILLVKDESYTYNPCFIGDTVVATADGRNGVTIKQLAEEYAETGKKFPVYSAAASTSNANHLYSWETELKSAIAFKTGEKHVITVHLSDGTAMICTPDHRLALNDGDYIEAQDSVGKTLFRDSVFIGPHNSKSPTVTLIVDNGQIEDVYDLTVDDNHNFYILTDCTLQSNVLVHNCVEVGMYPTFDGGEIPAYGWSVCNLTEINGGHTDTRKKFLAACKASAVLGTIQASYTDFDKYLSPTTRKIIERDALIGVGITGMAENPDICFNAEIQREGAELVKKTNQEIADILGINHAARTTVIKPSGNSSQLLGTASGVHPFHFQNMVRHIQVTEEEQAANIFGALNPKAIESSVYGGNVLAFPISVGENALIQEDLTAIDFLEKVKLTQTNWIEYGTNFDHQSHTDNPTLRHNVSNTCKVMASEWDMVRDYLWEERENFCGVSMLGETGDLDYPQAPFTSYLEGQELVLEYGEAAILAGGLNIDGLAAFSDNLWLACDTALGRGEDITLTHDKIASEILAGLSNSGAEFTFKSEVDGLIVTDTNAVIQLLSEKLNKKKDWIRRFKKFGQKYFRGDMEKTAHCLKHVSIFHKWQNLKRIKSVDWSEVVWEETYTDADTLSAQGCAGGKCEV